MSPNNENWDVIIVGAGPSGLGVGAQLAHAGKKVLVLEKEKSFGGRASTSSHAGVTFDNGPHAPMMAGDMFTAADISVIYALGMAERLGLSDRFGPEIEDYRGRMAARPAFRRASEKWAPPGQG